MLVVSCLPGSSLAPHGSTKQLPSTWHFLSAWPWHPLVSSSISEPAMQKSAARLSVFRRRVGRAQGMEVGTHPRREGGLETVIPDLSTLCRKFFTELYSYSYFIGCWLPCRSSRTLLNRSDRRHIDMPIHQNSGVLAIEKLGASIAERSPHPAAMYEYYGALRKGSDEL